MGEARQQKQKVTFRVAKQPFDELEGQYSRNSSEVCEFYCSHVQVENPVSVTGGHSNTAKTMTPQNVFSHTNLTTQPRVNNEPLHSTKGSGAPCTHPL